MIDPADIRPAFSAAADWFLDVVRAVPDGAWGAPGLGEWTVRELVGHTARALGTVESYLDAAPAEVVVPDVVTYFRLALEDPAIHESVARRGREAGAGLGEDPSAAVTAMAESARARADATADDAVCGSAVGGMPFVQYLATRAFELTVHTADLAAALGRADPPPPPAARLTLSLLADLAAAGPDAGDAILALAGRAGWRAGRSVLG